MIGAILVASAIIGVGVTAFAYLIWTAVCSFTNGEITDGLICLFGLFLIVGFACLIFGI